jgi:predicted CoA-binding protein
MSAVARFTTMAASTGEEMLKKNDWAVVGNHGRNPVVEKLCDRLRSHGKTVFRVNPYGKPPAEYKSLTEIGAAVECVNLVVNPTMGLDVLDECEKLGIASLFVQPGAGSDELRESASGKSIALHEGCVLVELPPSAAL